ncbi:CLUMA_CG020493, isoform A [Clunio marinus]|uniref:CLUMA_CG020493, isoform A n=1 Tax=Clunio marinus TaxID=568069 RepID=A0A1J1J549_9DIPT|nr:CLUMA_CG020493, isoform A [Clunio marinus]
MLYQKHFALNFGAVTIYYRENFCIKGMLLCQERRFGPCSEIRLRSVSCSGTRSFSCSGTDLSFAERSVFVPEQVHGPLKVRFLFRDRKKVPDRSPDSRVDCIYNCLVMKPQIQKIFKPLNTYNQTFLPHNTMTSIRSLNQQQKFNRNH